MRVSKLRKLGVFGLAGMLVVRVAVAVVRCSVSGLPVGPLAPFEWASAIWQCVGEKLVVSINTIRFIHLLINKFYSKLQRHFLWVGFRDSRVVECVLPKQYLPEFTCV